MNKKKSDQRAGEKRKKEILFRKKFVFLVLTQTEQH